MRSPGPATGTTEAAGGAGAPTTGSCERSITSGPVGAGAATAAGMGSVTGADAGALIALATNMPPPSAATASRVRVGAILVMFGTRTTGFVGSPMWGMNLLRLTAV